MSKGLFLLTIAVLLGLAQTAAMPAGMMTDVSMMPAATVDTTVSDASAMTSRITPGSNCPDCFVTQVCGNYKWTGWINRDRPGGTGDWETIADAVPFGGCKYPIWIECVTTSGISWWKTGEIVNFNGVLGCYCVNSAQPDGRCDYDYQIRELCP